MASAFSHAAAALALGVAFARPEVPRRVWVLGAVCAALPDLDVVAFRFGIPYEHVLGHRGLSHSFAFSAALAGALVLLLFRRGVPGMAAGRLWLYLFLATASHGVLDALTDGGLGVAFFAPLWNERWFFPFRPIRVSPIGAGRFFTARGLEVLASELRWVWLPSLVFALAALGARRRLSSLAAPASPAR
jgi:inner membrane protein